MSSFLRQTRDAGQKCSDSIFNKEKYVVIRLLLLTEMWANGQKTKRFPSSKVVSPSSAHFFVFFLLLLGRRAFHSVIVVAVIVILLHKPTLANLRFSLSPICVTDGTNHPSNSLFDPLHPLSVIFFCAHTCNFDTLVFWAKNRQPF